MPELFKLKRAVAAINLQPPICGEGGAEADTTERTVTTIITDDGTTNAYNDVTVTDSKSTGTDSESTATDSKSTVTNCKSTVADDKLNVLDSKSTVTDVKFNFSDDKMVTDDTSAVVEDSSDAVNSDVTTSGVEASPLQAMGKLLSSVCLLGLALLCQFLSSAIRSNVGRLSLQECLVIFIAFYVISRLFFIVTSNSNKLY